MFKKKCDKKSHNSLDNITKWFIIACIIERGKPSLM